MRFFGAGGEAGGDRVKPRLERAQAGQQTLRIEAGDWEQPDDIDDMMAVKEGVPLGRGRLTLQPFEVRRAAELRPLVNEARARDGHLEPPLQRLGEAEAFSL